MVARRLRAAGRQVVLDCSPRKLDKKLRDAERQGAAVVAVIGEDEVAERAAALRHLASRRQNRVDLDSLIEGIENVTRGEP